VRLADYDYRIEPNGCWTWLGRVDPVGGYGRSGKHDKAHRAHWEERRGPIPPGRELHHLCENKLCINPDHMVALTHEEHMQVHARLRAEAKSNR
jgi:hypothetical protein